MSVREQATSTASLWRAVLVLGALATAAGVLGIALALADGVGFAEPGIETRVWWFHHANPLGGFLTTVAGLVGIASGLARSPALTLLAAAAMLLLAAGVMLGQAVGANVLGGSASTVGLCLGLGGGLLACALTARGAER